MKEFTETLDGLLRADGSRIEFRRRAAGGLMVRWIGGGAACPVVETEVLPRRGTLNSTDLAYDLDRLRVTLNNTGLLS